MCEGAFFGKEKKRKKHLRLDLYLLSFNQSFEHYTAHNHTLSESIVYCLVPGGNNIDINSKYYILYCTILISVWIFVLWSQPISDRSFLLGTNLIWLLFCLIDWRWWNTLSQQPVNFGWWILEIFTVNL